MILQELLINYPDEVKAAIEIKIDANRHDTLEKWTEAELTRYRKAMMVFIEELKQLIPEKSENPCVILGGKYRDSWYDGEVDEYIAVNIFRTIIPVDYRAGMGIVGQNVADFLLGIFSMNYTGFFSFITVFQKPAENFFLILVRTF